MPLTSRDGQFLVVIFKLYAKVPADVRDVWWKPLICALPTTALLEFLKRFFGDQVTEFAAWKDLVETVEQLKGTKSGLPLGGQQDKAVEDEKIMSALVMGAHVIMLLCDGEIASGSDGDSNKKTPTPASYWDPDAQVLASRFSRFVLPRFPEHARELDATMVSQVGHMIKVGLIAPAATMYTQSGSGNRRIDRAAGSIIQKLSEAKGTDGHVALSDSPAPKSLIGNFVKEVKDELKACFVQGDGNTYASADMFMLRPLEVVKRAAGTAPAAMLHDVMLGVIMGGSISLQMLLPPGGGASASASMIGSENHRMLLNYSLGQVSRRYHKFSPNFRA